MFTLITNLIKLGLFLLAAYLGAKAGAMAAYEERGGGIFL